MGAFSYMQVYCPICRGEFDGMRGYGRADKCCCKECYDEWEWRKTLAIMGQPYQPRKETQDGQGEAKAARISCSQFLVSELESSSISPRENSDGVS